jgi:hypothetical protein
VGQVSNLSSLYHLIKPYATSAPEAAIDAEIVAAAKEMARRTLTLRDREWIDTQANWGEYILPINPDRHLESVTQVSVDGVCIKPLGTKSCNGCDDIGYWLDKNKTLYIYPTPSFDQLQGIEFEYAYSPAVSSCDVDQEFIERFSQDLAWGALSNLLLMKGQKWYEPKLAEKFEGRWEKAKNSALVDGPSLYTRGYIELLGNPSAYLDS